MVAVTTYASLGESILKIPAAVTGDRWFQATLFDAYFGFLTFFVWVAYKEACLWRAVVWFVLIMVLGNMAMSAYMLIQLFKVPSTASLREVLLRS
jgi:hypothetical protein